MADREKNDGRNSSAIHLSQSYVFSRKKIYNIHSMYLYDGIKIINSEATTIATNFYTSVDENKV